MSTPTEAQVRSSRNAAGRLRVGPALDADFGLHLGSGGVLLSNIGGNQTLLGFEFQNVDCALQVPFASLGNAKLKFKGTLPSLPAPFPSLTMSGEIPASGPFTLAPLNNALQTITDLPGFPLANVVPSFEYKPGDYANIVRGDGPSGYWQMEENIPRTAGGFPPTAHYVALADASPAGGANGRYEPTVPVSPIHTPPVGRRTAAFDTNSNFAVFFDGVDDLAWVATSAESPRFNNTGEFTVELWFRRATSGIENNPAQLAAHGDQWGLELVKTAVWNGPILTLARQLQFAAGNLRNPYDASLLPPLVSKAAFDDTNWHQVVAVFDGAIQLLYVDGRLDSWRAANGTPSPTGQPISLAALVSVAEDGSVISRQKFFAGSLDEVAVYDRALSPVEVLDHHLAAGRGGVRMNGQFDFLGLTIGSPPPSFTGLIGRDGSRALQINSGQPDPLNLASTIGIAFPETRVALFSVPGQVIATLDGSLNWPRLFSGRPAIKGFFSSTNGGELNVHATDLGTPQLPGFPHFRFATFDLTKRGGQLPKANFTGDLTFPLNAGSVSFAGKLDGGQFSLKNSANASLCAGPGCFEFDDGALAFTFGVQDIALSAAGRYRVANKDPLTAHLAWSTGGSAAFALSVDTGWIQPKVSGPLGTVTFPGSARAYGNVAFEVNGRSWAMELDGTLQAAWGSLPPLNADFHYELGNDGAFRVDQSLGGYSGFQFDLW